MPPQQPPQKMLIDLPQSAHAHPPAKLMEHASRRDHTPQAGKPAPGRLFRQLRDDEIERTRGGQPRQQMHAPQLRRAQNVTPTAGEIAGTELGDKVVRHIAGELFEQRVSADGRQKSCHA